VLMVVHAASVTGGVEFFSEWLRAGQSVHEPSLPAHSSGPAPPPEPDRWTNYKPQFFTAEQLRILDSFTAILIPTDETPGAREAHVAPFIDFVVNAAADFSPQVQQEWRKALEYLEGNRYGELSNAEQEAFVAKASGPERNRNTNDAGFQAYRLIKQMTV